MQVGEGLTGWAAETREPVSIAAEAHLDAALHLDHPVRPGNAEGDRVEVGGKSDEHGGHTDEAVERRDQLRHVGHLDPPRGDEAEAATDRDSARNLGQAGKAMRRQRGYHRDGHADNAVAVARTARGGAGKPA
jgi:hypothetical protein